MTPIEVEPNYAEGYRDGYRDGYAMADRGYDEKSRGPEYRRGFADGRLAERSQP